MKNSKNNGVIKYTKSLLQTFAFPIFMWVFFAILIELKVENNIFVSAASFQDIFQTSTTSVIIAIAVALPLSGGRWDFGPGAIMVVTSIVAGNLAIEHNMGIGMLLVLSVVIAVGLALFEGSIYLIFKVPTMIVSLGIVMLYEAISGLIYDGSGVRLFMYEDLSILARQPYCYIITAIVLLGFWILMKYTKFGYDSRSLGNNAALSINNGVNEKKNIMLTYLVVGILLGIASLMNASKAVVAPQSNLGSTFLMFSSMGAVLVGLYLARFSNMALGILSGTIAMTILSKGLTVYGMPSSLNNIILGVFIVVFMGYTTNVEIMKEYVSRIRRKKAKLAN